MGCQLAGRKCRAAVSRVDNARGQITEQRQPIPGGLGNPKCVVLVVTGDMQCLTDNRTGQRDAGALTRVVASVVTAYGNDVANVGTYDERYDDVE